MNKEYNEIENEVKNFREKNKCTGLPYTNLDELPFTENQKALIVEYIANVLAKMMRDYDVWDGHGKHYDPMTIDVENKEAHTYVFDLWDGGRHHPFENYQKIIDYVLKEFVWYITNIEPPVIKD